MARIEAGFPGERFVVLPQPFLDLMEDNPLTGDLYIHSLGHIAHARHHHVSRPEGSPQHVFLYCTWGRGEVEVDRRRFTLSANRFVVLPAGVPHVYRADDDDPWTLYWVLFGGEKASVYAAGMTEPRQVLPSVHSRIEQRTDLFETIYSVLCGGFSIEKLNYANIVLAHFLASFLYADLFRESVPVPAAVKYADSMVSRVTHFMAENVESNLTLSQIASYAGYSESYFYRRFVKETGHAPIDYFIHLKINKASIFLIKTSLTVAQIAAKLGFNSPDYFSRTFRRIVGISASEFRKQNFRL